MVKGQPELRRVDMGLVGDGLRPLRGRKDMVLDGPGVFDHLAKVWDHSVV